MAYLEYLPPHRVKDQWDSIWRVIRRAAKLDGARDPWMVKTQALFGQLQFWKPGKPMRGYVVTQVHPGAICWVIYAAGFGASLKEKRELMALIETMAKDQGCTSIQFEGRDWRKVFPDYSANQTADGRWHFAKGV